LDLQCILPQGAMSGVLHHVLVLGSGFTSGPLVEYLTRDGSVAVTVGG